MSGVHVTHLDALTRPRRGDDTRVPAAADPPAWLLDVMGMINQEGRVDAVRAMHHLMVCHPITVIVRAKRMPHEPMQK